MTLYYAGPIDRSSFFIFATEAFVQAHTLPPDHRPPDWHLMTVDIPPSLLRAFAVPGRLAPFRCFVVPADLIRRSHPRRVTTAQYQRLCDDLHWQIAQSANRRARASKPTDVPCVVEAPAE